MVVLAGFIFSMTFGVINSYGLFFLPILSEFHLSHTETSSVYSLSLFTFAAGSLLSGRLGKWDARLVGLVGSMLFGGGLILSGFAQNVLELYFTFGVLVAVGWGLVAVISLTTTTRWFTDKRGLAMGIITSGSVAGVILIPPLIGTLVTGYGWRTAFLGVGVVMLVILLAASCITRTGPVDGTTTLERGGAAAGSESDIPARAGQRLGGSSLFWLILTSLVLAALSVQSFLVGVVPYLVQAGYQEQVVSFILPTIGAGGLLSRTWVGYASDKLGRMKTLVLVYAGLSAGILSMTIVHGLFLIFLDSFLFGIAWGGYIPVSFSAAGDAPSSSSLDTRMAIIQAGTGLGGLAGPLLTGYLHDVYGSYTLGFWVISGVSLVSAVLAFTKRRPN